MKRTNRLLIAGLFSAWAAAGFAAPDTSKVDYAATAAPSGPQVYASLPIHPAGINVVAGNLGKFDAGFAPVNRNRTPTSTDNSPFSPRQTDIMNLQDKALLAVLVAFCGMGLNTAPASEPLSIESLLHEMIDRDAVARFPEPEFRLKQASSYNRASKSPADAAGWFANHDFNKGPRDHNFVRLEENHGQKEWVLMEDDGPGAIVRIWMPFKKPPENVLVRFYLDGSTEPALEGNPCTLLNGQGLIPPPFGDSSLLSAVSYCPIPYAKSCKVTMTGLPFFYQITYREYAAGTAVKTFTLADFKAAASLTERVGNTLLNPQSGEAGKPLGFTATLDSNQEKSLVLPAGIASVRELSVKLGSYENPNVTRTTVLKMEFDGRETVWCPVGDFFGSGIGLNPFQGWYRTVLEDGAMTCRWIMPYQKSGKVTVANLGDQPVKVELNVKTGAWSWDDRSMYFHANWRGQYPVPTRPHSDWNYIALKGCGVYVGDTLTIMNPVAGWWGEGDEKIWVDGEGFPSLFGTGTEDYYGYSWGGVSTDFYEHPFHAQPRAHVYNKLHRKQSTGKRDTRGFSVETRTRALDTIPFATSLQLDMEVWSGSDCNMGYAVGTYWYGFANATANRKPEPVEVLNVPPLPDMTKE